MTDIVPDHEWNEWIETGSAEEKRLLSIALRIRQGHQLTSRECSIYVYHGPEIEALLKDL